MFSVLVKEILEVVEEVTNKVFNIADKGDDLSIEELEKIITEAIKIVAENNKVEESTVRAAVTRRIEADMKTFRSELKDFLFGNRDPLINRVINNRVQAKDSSAQIRAEFQSIL